ncbi:MAG: CehA/McbA family metallohydrolase [Chloroflexaceae bacterium]
MHIYPGALHIHTTCSDGTGSYADVIAAARAAGLRWIIVTDHDTLAGQSFAGWHDDLLVIVGYEITPPRNHFLTLNVDYLISNRQPAQDFVDEVYRAGGFGIIAHPDEQKKNAFKDIYRWDNWAVDGPRNREGRTVGLELWNLMSDWGEHMSLTSTLPNFLVPRLGISGPTPATLHWWDQLNMAGRRTFGVGGVDAHAFTIRAPWGRAEVFPYRWMFGTLTNYLLLNEPLSSDAYWATHQVFGALIEGRSYFVNRLDGTVPAVPFAAIRGTECWQMGDTPSLAGGALTFVADLGGNALLRLIRNGEVVTSACRALRQSIDLPGVYRLEGYRGGRPWLYTNPIYVEP